MKSNLLYKVVGATGTLATLALMAATAAGTVSAATAATDALTTAQTTQAAPTGQRQAPPQLKNVQRSVQNISNGVQISLTSTDADTVTKLQSFKPKQNDRKDDMQAKLNITVSQTNITNGVQITMTSTDATTVAKIQEDAKNGRGPGFGGPGMGRHMGMNGEKAELYKNVNRAVQNVENGVQITLTSTDAATVKLLQEDAKNGRGPGFGGPGMGRHMGMNGDALDQNGQAVTAPTDAPQQ